MPNLDFTNLGAVVLAKGDDDSLHTWGGVARPGTLGNPVRQLQTALVAVGALDSADGQFGGDTRTAVARFQWYRANIGFRLNSATGGIVAVPTQREGARGACDASLAADLLEWTTGGFATTTPLVRMSVAGISNTRIAPTFRILQYPTPKPNEILAHADFVTPLRTTMNEAARAANVILQINQCFRSDDIPPSGAVVPPAKKSQHLVGHAVDLNIVDGPVSNSAGMFLNGTATPAALAFIKLVKAKGLRWGGDFSTRDPIHFDDFLDPDSDDYDFTHYFVQNSFRQNHPMREA